MKNHFGSYIQTERVRRNLSQQAFADACEHAELNVSIQTIKHVELGKHNAQPETRRRLEAVLELIPVSAFHRRKQARRKSCNT